MECGFLFFKIQLKFVKNIQNPGKVLARTKW